MLKFSFPIGEFFHHHKSDKIVCAENSGKECKHTHHISVLKINPYCTIYQIYSFFDYQPLIYYLFVEKVIESTFFFLSEYVLIYDISAPWRAPPVDFFL
ncbi:hypothetical protein [Capnocytophaga catalasegens]|uniref:Uncharacterized protein n=1 Tax=Capnocytophaga catalasegens TaxID=1004260 RepID=A0AAV5AZZ7_9FLAO|nr:hypothetical protein [Capnocytophaga catalasegens]GIZ14636.1 hypothetical protein RCZ03_06370 [Capnocytophaga catalasegens]GJM50838.1 hypothetical protein RCZ15_18110 [Capnocytophaga catalasegens]GJM51991.1 hypothetical protein RCZ16_03090 [Capnocytophaga catalasegens]